MPIDVTEITVDRGRCARAEWPEESLLDHYEKRAREDPRIKSVIAYERMARDNIRKGRIFWFKYHSRMRIGFYPCAGCGARRLRITGVRSAVSGQRGEIGGLRSPHRSRCGAGRCACPRVWPGGGDHRAGDGGACWPRRAAHPAGRSPHCRHVGGRTTATHLLTEPVLNND